MTDLPEGLSILSSEQHDGKWWLEFMFFHEGRPAKIGTCHERKEEAVELAVRLYPKSLERLKRDGYDLGMG